MSQLLIFTDKKTGFPRSVMSTPKKERRKPNAPDYGYVKPNKMFPNEAMVLIRCLHFKKPVPCALCGRKSKRHWTTCVPFHAADINDPRNQFTLQAFGPLFPPLTPVCNDHILQEDRETMLQMVGSLRYFADLILQQWEAGKKDKEKSHLT